MSAITKAAGWPLRRILNPRIRWVIDAVGARLDQAQAEAGQRLQVLDERVGGMLARAEILAIEATNERRATDEGLTAVLDGLRKLEASLASVESGYQVPPLDHRTLGELTWPVAELLNWAEGGGGYAAQAGLWFNNPLQVAHDVGAVTVLTVNERILETGYVFGVLAGLEPGSQVLDVGGSQSTMALSLASLGHRVTVVDPGGYNLEHPNLEVVEATLADFEPERDGFDAAVALSSIEHFGRPHYDLPESPDRIDLEALADLRRRVRPGGLLALTTPFGEPSVDDFQRVYDLSGLHELLDGWEVLDLSAGWRTSPTRWERGDPEDPRGDAGVALVAARRPD